MIHIDDVSYEAGYLDALHDILENAAKLGLINTPDLTLVVKDLAKDLRRGKQ